MDVTTLIGVTVLLGIPVILLRRISRLINPLPRDSYGYQLPSVGGGVTIFGSSSQAQAASRARDTITRLTEVE